MKLVYFKELNKYKLSDIIEIMETSTENTLEMINDLILRGIVKVYSPSNEEILVKNEKKYIFDFVGIISIDKYVIMCYPKYINVEKPELNKVKQIIKVIEKYKGKKNKDNIFDIIDEQNEDNQLSVILYLINNYFEQGFYINEITEIETDVEGEILWDETIEENVVILNNGIPIYLELVREGTVEHDNDYYTRLHKCILTECSRTLRNSGILELLGKNEINVYEGSLEEFGEIDYIIYKIEQELNVQYISYKKNILKSMYIYLKNKKINKNKLPVYFFGTKSYNLIWQDVCSQAFNNQANNKIKNLICKINEDKFSNNTLIEIIEKPLWRYFDNDNIVSNEASRTVIPDIISIYEVDGKYCFGILDAKYYNIELNKSKVVGQPGVEDIIKQYVYYSAYEKLINSSNCEYVQNAFLFPDEGDEVKVLGEVDFSIISNKINNCKYIAVIKLPTTYMYDIYLKNGNIKNVDKIIGHVKKENN